MIKFAKIIILSCALLVTSWGQAALITDTDSLTSDYYVTYYGDDVTIDFAWASPVNTEYWGDPDSDSSNRLYDPTLHEGWDYATDGDLAILKANFSLADFQKDDGSYKHAVEFWNSVFVDIVTTFFVRDVEITDTTNLDNYTDGKVSSQWVSSGVNGMDDQGSEYETFYVRKTPSIESPDQNPDAPEQDPTVKVPEPTTIMILSIGLIALSLRSRFSK